MEKKFKLNLSKKKTIISLIIVLSMIASVMFIAFYKIKVNKVSYTGELARSMAYDQVKEGEEDVVGTDYVKFDAFFLRDLDGDGYAEKLRGSSRQIGKEDTLYMELSVLTNGYLEDGVITINSDNFYFQTALPKDSEIKENAVGSNIKQIKLNTINNGTQKMLTGMIHSGDYGYTSTVASAIGIDITKYSKENSITLTGTHVEIVKDDNGNDIEKRTPIEKTVKFDIDWHGTTKTEIPNRLENKDNLNQQQILEDALDEENNEFTTEVIIGIQEINNELILEKAHIETEIPELSGCSPLRVEVVGSNVNYTYDNETRMLIAEKEAVVDENGEITTQANDGIYGSARYNKFKVLITYPLEAYKKLGASDVFQELLVNAYYEGFNNINKEFINPYKSNISTGSFTLHISNPVEDAAARFDIYVGNLLYTPSTRYVVSKENVLKIYNEISDTSVDDTYIVSWCATTSESGNSTGLLLQENNSEDRQIVDEFIKKDGSSISMEDISSNIGIYFANPRAMLGEDGWIKVYDVETDELLETFTKDNWSNYTRIKPYKYERPIKHIRIETSSTNINSSLNIYNLKKLDTEYITENISREEFDEIVKIKSILNGYLGGNYINTSIGISNYEAPYAKTGIEIKPNVLSTQETQNNIAITVKAEGDQTVNQVMWLNGTFLLKLPKEILDLEINSVISSKENVKVISYEYYEEDGDKFIKINTENSTPEIFDIVIDCNITPDPRMATKTDSIILYSYNEATSDYWTSEQDIYDVNDNLNQDEKIGKTSTDITFVSPNLILTNESITDYDTEGSVVISPQIAILSKEQRTANINIEIKNNYLGPTSDVVILGRVPFENNKYVISGKEMGSDFSVKMETGISMIDSLMEQGKIYYSENGEATKDLSDSKNNWTTTPEDFSKVKSYLIDLSNYVFEKDETTQFSYTVRIPDGLNYNQISYSHHAMYFSLNTPEGKYRTQIEPNKIGLMIGKEYNLEVIKHQTGKAKLVGGATYSIIEEGEEAGKTRVTGIDGKLVLNNLYVDRTYIVKEIKSPSNYELNTEEIKFKATEENGQLNVSVINGNANKIQALQPDAENGYRVQIQVEDEVKPSIKIIKTEQGTDTKIKGVRFRITGEGLSANGKILTTNDAGEVTLNGLFVGTEYTLEEVKANGYYLENPIKFTIENNNGNYSIKIIDGNIAEQTTTEIDSIPTINLKIENVKIPTYDLEITKVKRTTDINLSETEEGITEENTTYLAGAKFKLYKDIKEIGEYISDENGKIVIPNLYQYVEGKDEEAIYTLKEVFAPEGYSKVKDITFKVQDEEGLKFINIDGNESKYLADGNIVKLTIEDSPSFKLIKKDGETEELLSNIKFAIYNVEDGERPATNSKGEILGTKEIIDRKEYYTISTDINGEITADLTEGLYKAVEVQAPVQYNLENKAYYFGIGASREGVKEWEAELYDRIGGTENVAIRSISKTMDGGIIAGGSFKGTITLQNGEEITSKGDYDVIAIKYDKDGEMQWYKQIGGTGEDNCQAVLGTSDGGVVIGTKRGDSVNTLEDGYTTTGNGVLLLKYNVDGDLEWYADTKSSQPYAHIQSIGETANREIVVAVRWCYRITLENGETLDGGQGYDTALIKYSETGEFEWYKRFDISTGEGNIYSIKSTKDGGIIIAGDYSSTILNLDDGVQIPSNGGKDGLIVKYTSDGEVEWYKQIGGTGDDIIKSIVETLDGGYVVGGYFKSASLEIKNEEVVNTNNGNTYWSDGIIIKYNSNGEIEWYKQIAEGYTYSKGINSIIETLDGGIIAGGYVNEVYENKDAIIFEYTKDGKEEWTKQITGNNAEYIYSLVEMDNGEILAGGAFTGNIKLNDNEIIEANSQGINNADGLIFKLDLKEVPEVLTKEIKTIGGTGSDSIQTIISTIDGGYVAGGCFRNTITLDNGDVLETNNSNQNGIIVKYDANGAIKWYKQIETNMSAVNSITETKDGGIAVAVYFSGTITLDNGEQVKSSYYDGIILKYTSDGKFEWYQIVSSNNIAEISSIVATDDGGIIAGGYFNGTITLDNSETVITTGRYDGIILKYSKEGELEYYIKKDQCSNDDKITSVAETADGGIIAGGYFNGTITLSNGDTVTSTYDDGIILKYDKNRKLEWYKILNTSSNDHIYSVTETSDGGIIAGGDFNGIVTLENGKEIVARNIDGIILKYNKDGKLEWNKQISEANNDYIYSVSETTDRSILIGGQTATEGLIAKYSKNGDFEWKKTIGTAIREVEETAGGSVLVGGEYKGNIILDNGETLTSKGNTDGFIAKMQVEKGVPEVQELVVENTRKEFKITTDINEIDGIKGGSISGEDASSYEKVKYGDSNKKEIILTPDVGYEIIGITVNGVEYQFTSNEDGTYIIPTFENITENKHIVVTYSLKENKIIINKIDAYTKESLVGAKFRLEQIEEDTDSELYNTEIETNSEGQAITQIPFGKYNLTEIVTPEGYEEQKGSVELEFMVDGTRRVIENTEEIKDENGNIIERPTVTVNENGEFIVENIAKSKVIVHHYLKGRDGNITEIEVADEEQLEGNLNDKYTTTPHLDLDKYELEKDESGEYIIPENAAGEYKKEIQEVIYYYVEKQIPLTVHHYIEGTTTVVPLVNGEIAQDENNSGYENEGYTTNPISNDRLSNEYELVEIPVNSEGIYTGNEVIVTYYYKRIERKVVIQKYAEDGETVLSGATFEIDGKEYITNESGKINLSLEAGEYNITETKAPEGYKLPENPITKVTIDRNTTELKIEVINERPQGTVTVHHYIKGTTDKVKLLDGTEVSDETKTGNIGSTYITSSRTDIQDGYVCVEEPENSSGTYIDGNIDVTYYYGLRTDLNYTVNYLEKGTDHVLAKQKNVENQTFGSKITSSKEVIDIEGYVYDSLEPECLTISSDNSKNIINIYYVKDEIDLKVTKYWDDIINENNKRPEQIKVIVKNGELQVAEAILTSDNAKNNSDTIWEYTFENLQKYDNDGNLITYTVEESEVEEDDLKFYMREVGNVIPEIDENGKPIAYTVIIINTFTVPDETIDIKVNKVWEDNNNVNGKRPNSIKLIVSKVETDTEDVVIEETIDESKEKIAEETVLEEAEKESEKELNTEENIEENSSNEILLNSIQTDSIDEIETIETEKTTIVSSHTLEVSEENFSKNIWEYTFTNLPKYDKNGKEIKYVVTEEIMQFYEMSGGEVIVETDIEGNNTYEATLTNTFTVPRDIVDIVVNKVWIDNSEQMKRRPESITIKLMNDDKELNQEIITAENGWTTTFAGVPKYDNSGNEIQYRVSEESVEFYTVSYGQMIKNENTDSYSIAVTNTFTGSSETTSIPVTTVWDDNNKERLSSIILVLTGNGKEYTQTVTKDNEETLNTWVYTFTGLPKYDDNGTEITYTLSEREVNKGDLDKYIQKVEGYIVTNTLIIKDSEIEKTGTTTISSLDETINYTISYKASLNENYTDDVTVTIVDSLPYEIDTEKPYNLNGGIYDSKNKTITWTEVMKAPIDITKEISLVYKDIELFDTATVITNSVKGSIELSNGVKEEKETSFDTKTNFIKEITLNKIWVGDNESSRPESIKVNLKATIKENNEAGEESYIDYVLPEELAEVNVKVSDNWTYVWNNLPKYDQETKQEIIYSVEEDEVPGYYNSLKQEENVFTLINYKYGNITITKVDSKNKIAKLGGAEFKLEKLTEENDEIIVDKNFTALIKTTSSSEENKGEANFTDLKYGKYRLTEIKAPEGYNLLEKTIEIEVSEENTEINLEISNREKTLLPATGGKGVITLTAIGMLAIVIAMRINTISKVSNKAKISQISKEKGRRLSSRKTKSKRTKHRY